MRQHDDRMHERMCVKFILLDIHLFHTCHGRAEHWEGFSFYSALKVTGVLNIRAVKANDSQYHYLG